MIKKIILPIFYIIMIIILIYIGIDTYNIKMAQKNRLLNFEDNLNINKIGTEINLELNDENKDEKVIFEVKDENIVKVDKNGNLISVGEGSTEVTVKTEDGSKSQTIIVNVGSNTTEENNNSDNNATPPTSDNNSDNNTNPPISDNNIETTITLNKTYAEIHLNTNVKTTTLIANVTSTKDENKTVNWTSSNTNVATVSDGIVKAINPGTTTITATTKDGKIATAQITVKKNIIIVIGASQVTRMEKYKTNYSSSKYNYYISDGTLVYIDKSGSGIDYQTNTGFSEAKSIINKYANSKNQVTFNIFFPLSGNTILNFKCSDISTSNSSIKQYASNYNSSIESLKNNGYNVKGYVISMHPVKVSESSSSKVVTNENKNSCTSGYRSNRKYYEFNKAMKSIVQSNYRNNLKYVETFTDIMEVNELGKNFSYKLTYNTTDGVHWNKATTNMYVDMMFNNSGDL